MQDDNATPQSPESWTCYYCAARFINREEMQRHLEAGHVAGLVAKPIAGVPNLIFPWRYGGLADWSIVGMNHYHHPGARRLFVAMTLGGRCIQAEGPDDASVWLKLITQSQEASE